MQHTISKYSLKVGLALLFIAWLTPYFSIQQPYWIIITCMAVMLPTVGATLERSKLRALSTVFGVIVGGFLAYVCKQNLVLIILLSFTLLFFACYFIQSHYTHSVFAFAALLVLLLSHFFHHPWQFALWRFIDTTIGIAIAFVFALILLPCWSKKSIKNTLKDTLIHLKSLSNDILSATQNEATTLQIEKTRSSLIQATEKLKKEFREMQHELPESSNRLLIMEAIILIVERLRLDLYLMRDIRNQLENNKKIDEIYDYSNSIFDTTLLSFDGKKNVATNQIPSYQLLEKPYLTQVIRTYLSDLLSLQKDIDYFFDQ